MPDPIKDPAWWAAGAGLGGVLTVWFHRIVAAARWRGRAEAELGTIARELGQLRETVAKGFETVHGRIDQLGSPQPRRRQRQ